MIMGKLVSMLLMFHVILVPIQGWCRINPHAHLLPGHSQGNIFHFKKLIFARASSVTPTIEHEEVKPPTMSLTSENVEAVLDKVRPYLESDGGNVELVSIDHQVGIVNLRLQGACRSCPSSVNTMKFGLEKSLKESIPSVTEVVNVDEVVQKPIAPKLSILAIDAVLNQIRPFITAAGGKVRIVSLDKESLGDNESPRHITLQLEGACSGFKSIKNEICSRIHSHFRTATSTLNIEWTND